PVLDGAGRSQGVAIANLDIKVLPGILNPELHSGEQVIAVDANHKLLYESSMGKIDSDTTLLAKGALGTTIKNPAVDHALAGEAGNASFRDHAGHAAVGGYDAISGLGWGVVVSQPRAVVLSSVHAQQRWALVIVFIGAALAIGFSIVFARRTTRPILRLAAMAERGRLADAFNNMVDNLGRLVTQTGAASTEVNASAAQLSASSEELAATTT